MLSRIIFALFTAIITLSLQAQSQYTYVQTGTLPAGTDNDVSLQDLACPTGTGSMCTGDIYVAVYGALVEIFDDYKSTSESEFPAVLYESAFDENQNICATVYWGLYENIGAGEALNFLSAVDIYGIESSAQNLATYIQGEFIATNNIEICTLFYSDDGWIGSGLTTLGWKGGCYEMDTDTIDSRLIACNSNFNPYY